MLELGARALDRASVGWWTDRILSRAARARDLDARLVWPKVEVRAAASDAEHDYAIWIEGHRVGFGALPERGPTSPEHVLLTHVEAELVRAARWYGPREDEDELAHPILDEAEAVPTRARCEPGLPPLVRAWAPNRRLTPGWRRGRAPTAPQMRLEYGAAVDLEGIDRRWRDQCLVVARQVGLRGPELVLRRSEDRPERSHALSVLGRPAGEFEWSADSEMLMVIDPELVHGEQIEAHEPAFGLPAVFRDPAWCEAHGDRAHTHEDVVMTHLDERVHHHAPDLLDDGGLALLLAAAHRTHPRLVERTLERTSFDALLEDAAHALELGYALRPFTPLLELLQDATAGLGPLPSLMDAHLRRRETRDTPDAPANDDPRTERDRVVRLRLPRADDVLGVPALVVGMPLAVLQVDLRWLRRRFLRLRSEVLNDRGLLLPSVRLADDPELDGACADLVVHGIQRAFVQEPSGELDSLYERIEAAIVSNLGSIFDREAFLERLEEVDVTPRAREDLEIVGLERVHRACQSMLHRAGHLPDLTSVATRARAFVEGGGAPGELADHLLELG